MSEETIALAISVAALMLSLAAGFGWTVRRIDGVRRDLHTEIKEVRTELGEFESRIRKDLGDRVAGVERELVEVKIAVARIEGPGRHLLSAR